MVGKPVMVGTNEGALVGRRVGRREGVAVGAGDGGDEGSTDGAEVGAFVGTDVKGRSRMDGNDVAPGDSWVSKLRRPRVALA